MTKLIIEYDHEERGGLRVDALGSTEEVRGTGRLLAEGDDGEVTDLGRVQYSLVVTQESRGK